MRHSPPSQGDSGPSAMTLQRLQQLLDTYGAGPERWPAEDRAAALALLAHSAEARAQRDKAARLDALLDLAPVVHPSAELAARILAAAPAEETQAERTRDGSVRVLRSGQRHQPSATRRNGKRERPRRMRVWPSLAVAAALAVVLWGVWTLPTSHQELPSDVIANLGVYTTPTDVLLQWPGVDIFDTLPSVGCLDSELGCPELKVSPGVESQSHARERYFV
jgi:hypothetical protein